MTISKLSNIPLKEFRRFLIKEGLTQSKSVRGRGGHEKWVKSGLQRPIILQSHIDPVPEFIVKQVLRYLNFDRAVFLDKMNNL